MKNTLIFVFLLLGIINIFADTTLKEELVALTNQLSMLEQKLMELGDVQKGPEHSKPPVKKTAEQEKIEKIINDNFKKNVGITEDLIEEYIHLVSVYEKQNPTAQDLSTFNYWEARTVLLFIIAHYAKLFPKKLVKEFKSLFGDENIKGIVNVFKLIDQYVSLVTINYKKESDLDARGLLLNAANMRNALAKIDRLDVIIEGFDPKTKQFIGYEDVKTGQRIIDVFPESLYREYQKALQKAQDYYGATDERLKPYKEWEAVLKKQMEKADIKTEQTYKTLHAFLEQNKDLSEANNTQLSNMIGIAQELLDDIEKGEYFDNPVILKEITATHELLQKEFEKRPKVEPKGKTEKKVMSKKDFEMFEEELGKRIKKAKEQLNSLTKKEIEELKKDIETWKSSTDRSKEKEADFNTFNVKITLHLGDFNQFEQTLDEKIRKQSQSINSLTLDELKNSAKQIRDWQERMLRNKNKEKYFSDFLSKIENTELMKEYEKTLKQLNDELEEEKREFEKNKGSFNKQKIEGLIEKIKEYQNMVEGIGLKEKADFDSFIKQLQQQGALLSESKPEKKTEPKTELEQFKEFQERLEKNIEAFKKLPKSFSKEELEKLLKDIETWKNNPDRDKTKEKTFVFNYKRIQTELGSR
ncbi:MAG: hypothetical protein AB7E68_00575 [Candidatus Babeliales bacterium]